VALVQYQLWGIVCSRLSRPGGLCKGFTGACSGAVLSPSELLLTSSPGHHSLACCYCAPLGNLSTPTDSVIDKATLEFVSNCARGVPFGG
jgi:hypothetical protein